jgi:hypothetical protein
MHELVLPTSTSSGLQHYDPEKGLLALAAAEAAHKHFARAKNRRCGKLFPRGQRPRPKRRIYADDDQIEIGRESHPQKVRE